MTAQAKRCGSSSSTRRTYNESPFLEDRHKRVPDYSVVCRPPHDIGERCVAGNAKAKGIGIPAFQPADKCRQPDQSKQWPRLMVIVTIDSGDLLPIVGHTPCPRALDPARASGVALERIGNITKPIAIISARRSNMLHPDLQDKDTSVCRW